MIKNKENQNTAQNTGKPGTSNYVPWRQTEINVTTSRVATKGLNHTIGLKLSQVYTSNYLGYAHMI